MGSLESAKVVLEVGSMTSERITKTMLDGVPVVSQFYVHPGTKTLHIEVQPSRSDGGLSSKRRNPDLSLRCLHGFPHFPYLSQENGVRN
jgi:hypothetical protein